MVKLYLSKDWLYQRYLVDRKTIPAIAKEAGVTRQTIYIKLKEFGILDKRR